MAEDFFVQKEKREMSLAMKVNVMNYFKKSYSPSQRIYIFLDRREQG